MMIPIAPRFTLGQQPFPSSLGVLCAFASLAWKIAGNCSAGAGELGDDFQAVEHVSGGKRQYAGYLCGGVVRYAGCNYCMPCPKGVNIPGCFTAYNSVYSMGYVAGMHQFVTSTALTSERSASPSLCVKCGVCESHCPQKLPIIEYLAQVSRRMEPFWVKFIGFCVRAFLGNKRKK